MNIDKNIFTRAVHAGAEPEPVTGAVNVPLFFTSTYVQDAPGQPKVFDYSRAGNPTREALERGYALIEDARFALTFSSGLAAEQAIVQILNPGAKVLVCDDTYGGTGRLFRRLFAKYDITFDFIDMTDLNEVRKSLSKETKLVWIESPTNPLMRVIDIQAVAAEAKKAGALVVVDNTFASPIFQSPLKLGADIVLHSTTKYLGGHSDLIGGCVMLNDQTLYDQLRFVQFAAGAVPGVMECFLLHRSLKTLAIRMVQHEKNALRVAQFLETHPKVLKVLYPGLESHPQHALAKRQMSGFSGMVSFYLNGDFDQTSAFVSRLKIFLLAESLGGVESLINHPERMTHASVPKETREKLGIGPNLLRLSCGIEDADDLIADLKQALG
jgi:cystathionine beta-lyase/cystathionine gamma-synthase